MYKFFRTEHLHLKSLLTTILLLNLFLPHMNLMYDFCTTDIPFSLTTKTSTETL